MEDNITFKGTPLMTVHFEPKPLQFSSEGYIVTDDPAVIERLREVRGVVEVDGIIEEETVEEHEEEKQEENIEDLFIEELEVVDEHGDTENSGKEKEVNLREELKSIGVQSRALGIIMDKYTREDLVGKSAVELLEMDGIGGATAKIIEEKLK